MSTKMTKTSVLIAFICIFIFASCKDADTVGNDPIIPFGKVDDQFLNNYTFTTAEQFLDDIMNGTIIAISYEICPAFKKKQHIEECGVECAENPINAHLWLHSQNFVITLNEALTKNGRIYFDVAVWDVIDADFTTLSGHFFAAGRTFASDMGQQFYLRKDEERDVIVNFRVKGYGYDFSNCEEEMRFDASAFGVKDSKIYSISYYSLVNHPDVFAEHFISSEAFRNIKITRR